MAYVYIYLYIMRNSRPLALLTYHKKCQCVEINLQISHLVISQMSLILIILLLV